MSFDYSEDIQADQTPEAFEKLNKLVVEMAEASAEVAALEAKLVTAKERLRAVSEGTLPALMDELQLSEFRTSSGLAVAVDEQIHASISEANQPAAFAWLEANGHGEIIKNEFKVQFGRAEQERAEEFAKQVNALGLGRDAQRKQSVHSSTLKAFVKEALAEGADIPTELFGVHRRRVAKVQS